MTQTSRIATININKTTQNYDLEEEITEYVPLTESQKTLAALGLIVNSGTPDFSKTSCSSGCEESTVGIYATEDNYGTSYYFRGNVENNYVNFANFYWRIIRINGNGTLRLIYDGTRKHSNNDSSVDRVLELPWDDMDSFHDDYYYENGSLKNVIDDWYNTYIIDNNLNIYVSDEIFCSNIEYRAEEYCISESEDEETGEVICEISGSISYYEGGTGSLICPNVDSILTVENKKLTYPVGLITSDEAVLAGLSFQTINNNNYLYRGNFFRTMTPGRLDSEVLPLQMDSIYNGTLTITDEGFAEYACVKEIENEAGDIECVKEYAVPVINLTKEYARTLKLNSDGVYVAQ